MNILDYWSGPFRRAHLNWTTTNWTTVVSTLVDSKSHYIEQITCYDPLCIIGKHPLTLLDRVMIGTGNHEDVNSANRYDTICLLHPHPATASDRNVLGWDEGFHTKRYISVVSELVKKNLKLGGHVIVQFDDEMQQWQHGKWREVFLERLLRYTDNSLTPVGAWWLGDEVKFQSENYLFSSLHLLQKKS